MEAFKFLLPSRHFVRIGNTKKKETNSDLVDFRKAQINKHSNNGDNF